MLNNFNEYFSPLIYDAEYGSFKEDFKFFLALKKQGHALDLACGTGRLTIPLAKKGFKTIGMDASLPMLDHARLKSIGFPIYYINGNICRFYFKRQFDLITLAGNSFQALLTCDDQKNMLESVKLHLKAKGIFAFNTRNPHPEELKNSLIYTYWHDFQDAHGTKVKVFGKQNYNPKSQIMEYQTKRVWPDHQSITDLKIRFTFFNELQNLFEKTGFKILNIYGDFNLTPFNKNSRSIIMAVQKI